MDLRQLAASKFAPEGKSLLEVKAASRVYPLVRSEVHTEPLLAALFWQILQSSAVYTQALQLAGASPLAAQQAETIVVAHGPGDNPRYDLVVLDPAYAKDEPTAVHLEYLDPMALHLGWERWQVLTRAKLRDAATAGSKRTAQGLQRSLQVVSAIDSSFPTDAMQAKRFGIIVARQPLLQATSVPSPYWSLVAPLGTRPISTVGVEVTDTKGRNGATVAFHSLVAAVPSVVPDATEVEIDMQSVRLRGMVRSIDQITDSAFIEFSPPPVSRPPRGTKGPLCGVSPRVSEQVTFEGLSSGLTKATVTGTSPDVPLVLPYSQLKVFTTPVTSPGDSGAALVDGDDHILGFSFYRTGIGQQIEFSAWIWADSVYAAHDLA